MSIPKTFNAEEAENLEDIEKQFAVKAVEHCETYWMLQSKFGASKLKLTGCDGDIYDDFVATFPEVLENNQLVNHLNEDAMKSKDGKAKWQALSKKYEERIPDFNFGTMLRKNADEEYTYDNTIFSFRLQFYAVEIFRNRHGFNDWIKGK